MGRESAMKRLQQTPGVGPLTSMALVGVFDRGSFTRVDSFTALMGMPAPRSPDGDGLRGVMEGARSFIAIPAMAALLPCRSGARGRGAAARAHRAVISTKQARRARA